MLAPLSSANDTSTHDLSEIVLKVELRLSGQLSTRLYRNRDGFNVCYYKLPYIDNYMPTAPAYGVYISHIMLRSTLPFVFRLCRLYSDFAVCIQTLPFVFRLVFNTTVFWVLNYQIKVLQRIVFFLGSFWRY